MSASANGEHRLFRDRRSAPAKGFDLEKIFWNMWHARAKRLWGYRRAPHILHDDAVLLSIDKQTGLGPGLLNAYITAVRGI
jgi:hypothetical protein